MGAVTSTNRIPRGVRAAQRRHLAHEADVAAVQEQGVRARLTGAWNWWLAEFAAAPHERQEELIARLLAEARELNVEASSCP